MFFPLVNFTHYSLQRGFSKPDQLVKHCLEHSYPACGIADYKTLSGCVRHFQKCKKAGIKPVLGCTFDGFSVFAKNHDGWSRLIEIVSNKLYDRECMENDDNLIVIDKYKIFPHSYYVNKEDAELHRILLCSGMKTTLEKAKHGDKYQPFFQTNNYYVQEVSGHSDKYQAVFDAVDEYDILHEPMLPHFKCPDGMSEEEYIVHLCREGWKKLLANTSKIDTEEKKQVYADRIKMELDVFRNANLFGYFLIVQDIIKFCHSQGWLTGPGRGSAAGCLVSYLIEITQVDPIEFDLLFERFYNAARTSSLPDIDMDVPAKHRDDIIAYLRSKYGQDNVAQMVTFGGLKGKSAVKEILRIQNACSFSEMNEISKYIANEADISDQLQDMDEEERSIVRWSLMNNRDQLYEYCHIDDNGNLQGSYAQYFQQAIDIEGTFKNYGKHAAGVVISREPLYKVCPMTDQKHADEPIASLEMNDLEAMGHVKFDLLGLSLLDKSMMIEQLVKTSSHAKVG